MNYRSIIKSRDLRIKILSYLGWVPDGIMLRLQYWLQTGRKLNLKNPRRFTEKLQFYKIKYRNPDMLRCTDKYEVRNYIKERGMDEYLIPLIGIFDTVKEIDFNALPRQFVAKTTDGGGGNQVLVCKDKGKLLEADFYERLNGWMSMPQKSKPSGREWAYENHFPRKILIEQLIGGEEMTDLPDYKFYCFDGRPHYCQLIQNRSKEETIDFYDMQWNHMPFYGLNPTAKSSANLAVKPQQFEKMKQIAEKLSKDYPFVRVDLYCVNQSTFFGELTFYPASGYGYFTPDEWDFYLGDLFHLENLALNDIV